MAEINTPSIPLKPFDNIAVAFSGGGFRAASFSLGSLSYLDNLQINGLSIKERISFISSASGGTITAMSYTAQRQQKVSFNIYFQDLLHKLSGELLLDEVLSTLNNDESWSQGSGKQRNLINSFAKVYDKVLFNGETLEVYFNKKQSKSLEVCFNTTEFYRGLSFRFQTEGSNNKNQIIGNNYLWFDNQYLDVFKKIKLADVLAASSCFPMGFEPIIYPQDFSYADNVEKALTVQQLRAAMQYENYNEEIFSMDKSTLSGVDSDSSNQKAHLKSFAFMDGGITDNQGLSSLMLADKKRRHRTRPTPFDLIIVTDVASYFMDSYESPEIVESGGWRGLTLGAITDIPDRIFRNIYTWQSAALAVAIICSVASLLFHTLWIRIPATALAASAFTIYIAIILFRKSGFGKKVIGEFQTFNFKSFLFRHFKLERFFSAGIIEKLLRYFKLTKVSVFEQMIKARIISVMVMVTDVNLKQVRRLIYEKFYNDPCWDDRRVPNFIYELSSHNQSTRRIRFNSKGRLKWLATDADKELLLEGFENLHPIAEQARTTNTALWFDAEQMNNDTLKKIVATGQFTTCANLLEYIISLERKKIKFDNIYAKELEQIKTSLISDLNRFKKQPYFLYDQLTNNSHNEPD